MVEESPALIRLEEHVNAYLRANDDVGYNRFTDFEWEKLKDSVHEHQMTDLHVGAVETAMLVEDHIPGYGSEYIRLFMVHEGRTDEEALKCRQMLHFVFRWVAEEDRHAHCLELWLRNCGRRDDKTLTDLMVTECKKQYIAPHDNPTQLFTYTAVQEKATQLFYSCLRQSVDEPILRAVLAKLSQDEARHCHFFSQMVLDALEEGNTRHIAQIKDSLQHFSMPLAMMMDNYKRKAIQMMRAARGYNYLDALEHFQRLVTKVMHTRTTGRGGPGSPNLEDLLTFTQQLMPNQRKAPQQS
jgi:acyl-[acyl-carrier-protein] desaturase